jgi:hypothetical protein
MKLRSLSIVKFPSSSNSLESFLQHMIAFNKIIFIFYFLSSFSCIGIAVLYLCDDWEMMIRRHKVAYVRVHFLEKIDDASV